MSKVIEDMRMQERRDEKRMTVLRMLNAGKYGLEEISDISGLPIEEVKKLQADQTA